MLRMRLLAALASASLPVAWLFAVPPLPPGSNGGLTLYGAGPRPLRAPQRLSAALGDAWWEERGAVPFSCTECGKCCQVRGDVWCSPDDAERLAEHLELDAKTLAERYGRIEVEGGNGGGRHGHGTQSRRTASDRWTVKMRQSRINPLSMK